MLLMCVLKERVESIMTPRFLTSAVMNVRKPGMDRFRWADVSRLSGVAMRIDSVNHIGWW